MEQAATSTRQKVYETIRRHITHEVLNEDDPDLDGETNLLATGIIDSMTMVGLIAMVERTYDVEIPDEEVQKTNFATLSTITALTLNLMDAPRA